MGYVWQKETASPVTLQPRPMGELGAVSPSGTASFLGDMSMTQILLIGGAAFVLGIAAHSMIAGVQKRSHLRELARKRRAKKIKATVSSALDAQNPMWQTVLLTLVAGGAVYYFARRQA